MRPDIAQDLPQTSVTCRDPIRGAVMHAHASTRQSLREGHVPHQAQATHMTHATEDLRQPQMGCCLVSQGLPGLC
jgi:hypothetical protein